MPLWLVFALWSRIATVTVAPDSLTLYVGDAGAETCTVRNQKLTILSNVCAWKILGDTTIARVTITSAKVTSIKALKSGTVRVVATAGGKADTATVRVLAVVGITAPVIYPKTFSVRPGSVQQLCAFVRFFDTGHIGFRRPAEGLLPSCRTGYMTLPDSVRAVTADEQLVADSKCYAWSATGGVISAEPCTAVPGTQS